MNHINQSIVRTHEMMKYQQVQSQNPNQTPRVTETNNLVSDQRMKHWNIKRTQKERSINETELTL